MSRLVKDRLVGILLGAAAVGSMGMAAWKAMIAPSVTVSQHNIQVPVLSVRAGFDYDVELTEPTLVWPAGTRLEPDRALYTYAGHPILHVRPFVEITGAKAGDATVWESVAVALSGTTISGKPLWQSQALPPREHSEQLALAEDHQAVGASGMEIPLDMAAYHDQVELIRENLGFSQVADSLVVTMEANVRAVVGGQTHDAPLQSTLKVQFQGEGFVPESLDKAVHTAAVHETLLEATQAPVSFVSRLLDQIGWLETAAAFLLLTGVYSYLRRPVHRPRSWRHPDHRKFKDWITEGSLAASDGAVVQVQSLQGLVDLAIDMKKRVIYDPDLGVYQVIDGDVLYRFGTSRPPASESTLPPRRLSRTARHR